MMKISDIKKLLSVDGVTVWYDHAPIGTRVPFITFTVAADNFFADNKVYSKSKRLSAILYTVEKDEALEELIEQQFDKASLAWTSNERYSDEEVYMLEYECEV